MGRSLVFAARDHWAIQRPSCEIRWVGSESVSSLLAARNAHNIVVGDTDPASRAHERIIRRRLLRTRQVNLPRIPFKRAGDPDVVPAGPGLEFGGVREVHG